VIIIKVRAIILVNYINSIYELSDKKKKKKEEALSYGESNNIGYNQLRRREGTLSPKKTCFGR